MDSLASDRVVLQLSKESAASNTIIKEREFLNFVLYIYFQLFAGRLILIITYTGCIH